MMFVNTINREKYDVSGVSKGNRRKRKKSGKEDINMATWMIMIGIEAVLVMGSIIAIAIWMKSDGGEEDELDRRLTELSEMGKNREAMEEN